MSSWWQQRTSDERRWLLLTALIVGLCFFWLLLWRPLLDDRRALADRLEAQQLALVEMQQMAQEVQRLQASEPSSGEQIRRDRRSLLALADESARARGLGDALRRVEPQGEQRVRMLIEDAQFAAVSAWLETLQFRLGVEVEEISIERRQLAGQVTVQLTLLDRRPPLQESN